VQVSYRGDGVGDLQPQGAVEGDEDCAVASRKNMKRGVGEGGCCRRGGEEEKERQKQSG
jgi:hypothetical protein